MGFNLGNMASLAGAAAGTALAPGIGTAVGASVGQTVANFFNGGGSQWSSAGPGVHAWFTAYGPQAFLDWMRQFNPDKFGNLDTVKGLQQVWIFQTFQHFNHLKNPNHALSTGWAGWRSFFAELGVDLDRSIAKNAEQGGDATGNSFWDRAIVVVPGQAPGGPPNKALNLMQGVVDNANGGQGPRTPAEQQVLDGIDAAAAKAKANKQLAIGAAIAAVSLLR